MKAPDLHLEITSKCALACPACPRTIYRGKYRVADLPLAAIERLVKSPKRYHMVSLCGDHGDPIYHAQFHEVIALLQTLPGSPFIGVSTNGSHRSTEWWRRTAEIMRPSDHFIFGIDGLDDTSALYRRGADWESIMNGIRILKDHGRCQVRWQWILFAHNEHQIPAAARLSRELGIDRFMIVDSSRHEETDQWRPSISIDIAKERFLEAYGLSAV